MRVLLGCDKGVPCLEHDPRAGPRLHKVVRREDSTPSWPFSLSAMCTADRNHISREHTTIYK